MNSRSRRDGLSLLARLSRVLVACIQFSVENPWFVISLHVAACLLAASQIHKISFRFDGRDLLLPPHAAVDASNRESGRLADLLAVSFECERSVFDPQLLQALCQLAVRVSNDPSIVPGSQISLVSLSRIGNQNVLVDTRPLLACTKITPTVAAAFEDECRRLALDDGFLLSANHRTAILYAEVRDNCSVDLLQQLRQEIVAKVPRGVRLRCHSGILAKAELGVSAARDLLFLSFGLAVTLAVCLALLFRHWFVPFFSLAEVGLSLVVALGISSALSMDVFITMLPLPILILAIGVSDDVFAFIQYYRQPLEYNQSRKNMIVNALARAVDGLGTSAISTCIGFIALSTSDLPPQRSFAIASAIAILYSSLATITLLPALLSLLPTDVRHSMFFQQPKIPCLTFALGWLHSSRAPVIILALASLFAVGFARHVKVNDSWIRNLPFTSLERRDSEYFDQSVSGATVLAIAIASPDLEYLAPADSIRRLLRFEMTLKQSPDIGAVTGPGHDVARLSIGMNAGTFHDFALPECHSCSSVTDLDCALADLFFQRQSSPRKASNVLNGHVTAEILVLVRRADSVRVNRILDYIHTQGNIILGTGWAVRPFGDAVYSDLAVKRIVSTQARACLITCVINYLVLCCIFGSIKLALIGISTGFISCLLLLAGLSITGVPMGVANSIFFCIILGAGNDYAIHFLAASQRIVDDVSPDALGETLSTAGFATVYSSVTVACGCGVMACSSIPPNAQLGVLVSIGLILSCLIANILVPWALRQRLRSRHKEGRKNDVAVPAV